jgi:molybdate transport repressor ModE-like protein
MLHVKLECAWSLGRDSPLAVDPALVPLLNAIERSGSLTRAAQETRLSYRHLWGLIGKWSERLGEPLVVMRQGQGARLAPLGATLLRAHTRVQNRLAPRLQRLAREIERQMQGHAPASRPLLTLHASHDVALAQLRDAVNQQHRLHLALNFHGSVDCLASLARRDCDIAGFHVARARSTSFLLRAPYDRWLKPRTHVLIQFVKRKQGLMVPRGNPRRIRSLLDLAKRRARFINRQPGSGTRVLFDHLLQRAAIASDRIVGYPQEEFTHVAVAAQVASGGADAGFGIEAAAVQYGLDFIPVIEEQYWFACRKSDIGKPAITAFVEALQDAEFKSIAAHLAGYDARAVGTVVPIAPLTVAADKRKSASHRTPARRRKVPIA